MLDSPSSALTVAQAALALGTHPEVIRRWLRQGRLQGTKLGRSWRIPPQSLPHTGAFPVNRLEGRVRRIDPRSGITWIDVGRDRLATSAPDLCRGRRVLVELGGENIFVSRRRLRGISARNQWRGSVTSLVQRQAGVEVHLATGPPLVVWMTPDAVRDLDLRLGSDVVAVFKAGACRVRALGDAGPVEPRKARRTSRRSP
jgi:molybdopterin-binding protein